MQRWAFRINHQYLMYIHWKFENIKPVEHRLYLQWLLFINLEFALLKNQKHWLESNRRIDSWDILEDLTTRIYLRLFVNQLELLNKYSKKVSLNSNPSHNSVFHLLLHKFTRGSSNTNRGKLTLGRTEVDSLGMIQQNLAVKLLLGMVPNEFQMIKLEVYCD